MKPDEFVETLNLKNQEVTVDILRKNQILTKTLKVNEKGEAFKSGECFAGFAIHKDESSESNFVEEVYKALLSIELSKHSKTKVIEDLCSTTSYSRNKIREAIDKLEGWGRIRSNRTAKGIQLEVVSNE